MPDPTQFTWSHLLYRLFDSDGHLLYVGRTGHFPTRMYSHAGTQPWWAEVARATVETHPDFSALDAAERRAIRDENPRHNTIRYVPPLPRPEEGRTADRKPRSPRSRPSDMATDDAVIVRPVDAICARGGRLPFLAGAVLGSLYAFMTDDIYETNRIVANDDEVARVCRAPSGQVMETLSHLVRAGWLVDYGGGVYDRSIPQSVFDLGADACSDGEDCMIHGGERGERGPVAPTRARERNPA